MASSTPENISVFLDDTRKRKWFFRAGTFFCVAFLIVGIAFFVFGLSFSAFSNKTISYEDAKQSYHYYYSAANNKKIALTFDDGPNPPASQTIMDSLTMLNAPATFFYIGKSALIRPDIVKEAADKGFDVEDHSFSHAQDVHASYNRLALELNSTGYLLSQITDSNIHLYRPPYLLGIGIDPTINPYLPVPDDMVWALKLGYLPVGSDIDARDWLATSPEGVVEGLSAALRQVPNGHIVLLHDDPNTAKAIPGVVAYLRDQGYTIVPLKELLTPPTVVALNTTLKQGDTDTQTNGDVSKLQWFLYQQKYLDPYALTGVFDSQTRSALVSFQTDHHLLDPNDPNPTLLGVAGPQTRDLIFSLTDTSDPSMNFQSKPLDVFSVGIRHIMKAVILGVYISLFPFLRNALVIMVSATLLMVVARTLGILFLLLLRWWRGENKNLLPPAMNQTPVSILIPAYNEQENIAATVESIIASSYYPREIIVINDGSKDNTGAEVEAVIEAHPNENLKLITTENGGKAAALNVGIAVAKNEIIVVLDADAVLDRDAVSYFVPHFNDPQIAAVAGKVRTTDAPGFLDIFQTLEYAIGQNIDKTAFSTIGGVGVVPGPAGAWRKQFLIEAGGFHTDTLVEDQEMTLCLLHMQKKVGYEPRAIAYTETPHSIENFLKQRFRWVYGTMQCFWKHKSVMVERPDSVMTLVVMPNVFVYNILLPLTYPFADSALVFGLIFGEWHTLVAPFLLFTMLDLLYATWGLRGEPNKWKLMMAVPLQRIVYRQLLYYTVYKALIRAIEGRGGGWNKFAKMGETRRFYLTAMGGVTAALGLEPELEAVTIPAGVQLAQVLPEEVTMAFQGPAGTEDASTNRHEVMSLSVMPRQASVAGEMSSPAFSPNVLVGVGEDPNT